MAPKVIVPMDFGRHLRDSPTHNTLTLKTSNGGEVLASSVILSFNSPVIDHMTTTLHMTSVDMLEFSEAAVQVFVDAAYSGTVEGINNTLFRDINKIAHAFKMTWLKEKCGEYFNQVARSINKPLLLVYTELVFLFEEATFALENLKCKEFYNVAKQKFEDLKCKQTFLQMYLKKVNDDKLTSKKLDVLIELADNEVHLLIQAVVNLLNLSKCQNSQKPVLSCACQYLLENTNLSLCKMSDIALFNYLFDLLGELPNEKMKWTLDLYRKAVEDSTCGPKLEITACCSDTKLTNNDFIPNMYRSLDFDMSFDEFMKWLSTSEEVTTLILAIEAVIAWTYDDGHFYSTRKAKNTVDPAAVISIITQLMKERKWEPLPQKFHMEDCNMAALQMPDSVQDKQCFMTFNWEPYCSIGQVNNSYVIIDCIKNTSQPLHLLLKGSGHELIFNFKHPSVTSCDLSGDCGFILKTVPSSDQPWSKMKLCTEPSDYIDKSVHYHEEIKADKMHVFLSEEVHQNGVRVGDMLYSISWLGGCRVIRKGFKSATKYKVLYNVSRDPNKKPPKAPKRYQVHPHAITVVPRPSVNNQIIFLRTVSVVDSFNKDSDLRFGTCSAVHTGQI